MYNVWVVQNARFQHCDLVYVEFYDQARVNESGYDLCDVSTEIFFLFFNFWASTLVETLLLWQRSSYFEDGLCNT